MSAELSTRLHGSWMWYRSSENKKWSPVWSVLRHQILFFFTSQETCMENHIGTLHLTKDSTFHYGQGDPKDGYRFEVHCGKRKTKFRVKTVYERELWRAYMEGVITGKVPQGVVLSPQDTQDITNKLQRVLLSPSPSTSTSPSPSTQGQPPPSAHHIPRPTLVDQHASSAPVLGSSPAHQDACSISSDSHGTTDRRPSMPSLSSVGTGSSSGGDLDPPGQRSLADFSIRDSSHNSEDSGRASDYFGGPFMHHKFDREGKASSPSWFFEDCSRELAEKILTQCAKHGNTLMRVSWTARNTGSYAISKRLMRTGEIEHYEVIRVAEGYKIGVENCNQTMKTLSEVMEFFIQLSGTTSTLPITCNDLQQLGVDYTDYSRRIVRHDDSSATVPVDSSADVGDNYEVPVGSGRAVALPTSIPQQPPAPPAPLAPPTPCLPKANFKTWGKDKTEEVSRQSQEHGGVAVKTVGPADRKTVKPDSAKPSVMQINENLQKQHEQDVVANLEAVIRGEEQKLTASKGSSNVGVSDRPPPLPVVPADRPKLCTGGSALYVNTPPTATTVKTEGEGTAHQRWNKRSQSVPVVTMVPDMDASVPANVVPPPLIKPSAGGSGGGGEKTPPPTAPKTVRLPPRASSLDRPDAPTKALSSIVQELQQKLQPGGAQPLRHVQARSSSDPRGISDLPPPPHAHTVRVEGDDEGEMYEDISQYYQNVPS